MLVLIGSLVLLIGAPVAWAGFVASGSPQIESVGERPSEPATETPVPIPAEPDVAGDDVPRIGTPVVARQSASVVAPIGITIERLGVEAPVDLVGVNDDGSVEIPDDITRVGWYRFGAGPRQGAGSTVIVGHRDGFDEGPGAFYSVSALNPGDTIELSLADGATSIYEVVSREAIDRDVLTSDGVFDENGPERLTLISCIGYFDRDNGGYQQNVVVTAIPMSERVGS
jgi:hypothetical protein